MNEINEQFENDITDIAISIVDELVEQGLIKDCTNTNDSTEFDFQDAIKDALFRYEAMFKDNRKKL
jgi:hypothetical protein